MASTNSIPGPRSGDDHDRVPGQGNLIKMARVRRNLTQAALARKCQVSHSVISRLENDQQQLTDPQLLHRLADVLEIPPSRLIHGGSGAYPTVTGAQRAPLPAAAGIAPPAQLPPDTAGFVARDKEFARLSELLHTSRRQPTSLPIAVISGTAGVGKSALAVHWAQSVADRFPDGQLYARLRGVDPAGPVDPGETLRAFLTALGADPKRLPLDLEGQTAEFRSRLSRKRVLVLLDDAYDYNQVKPLLPGSPGCLVLVTSRKEMIGLITKEGARPISLDLLSHEESRELIARRVGEQRLAEETEAADEIIATCARLPLALAIVGARAQMRPQLPLASFATQLRDDRYRLDLMLDEPGTELSVVFSWSYRLLSADAQRLFRLLGLHSGPDISTAAVASLAALPLGKAQRLLDELARANLLNERIPGRFDVHDLLRTYAAELSRTWDSESEREAAILRLLDHYLMTASTADRLLRPKRTPVTLTLSRHYGVTPEPLRDSSQAMKWCSTELPVLRRILVRTGRAGLGTYIWQLAWALDTYLDRQAPRQDYVAVWSAALEATLSLDDRAAEATARRGLAHALTASQRCTEAQAQLRQAVKILRGLGERTGLANTFAELVAALYEQGRYRQSLGYAHESLLLFRATHDRKGEARALNDEACVLAQLGDYEAALSSCQEALVLHRDVGDIEGESHTCDTLGYLHHRLGRYEQAIEHYRRALTLFQQQLEDRYETAYTLDRLGDTYAASGQTSAALESWGQALAILTQLHHPKAESVRTKLARSADELDS